MGVGNLGGDLGLVGVLSTLLLSVGDGLSAGEEGGDDNLRLLGGGGLDGGLGLGGVLSTLLLSVGDGLSAGGEGEDDDLRLLGDDDLEVDLGLGDVFPDPFLVLVDGLRAGGEDEGDDLRLLGVGVPLRSLRGVVVLVCCWGVLDGDVGDLSWRWLQSRLYLMAMVWHLVAVSSFSAAWMAFACSLSASAGMMVFKSASAWYLI